MIESSAWQFRGLQRIARIRLAKWTLRENGGDLVSIAETIHATAPHIPQKFIGDKVLAWWDAAFAKDEGTAAYGRQLRAARAGDPRDDPANVILDREARK